MRILFVTALYRPVTGGIEILLEHLGNELRARGHDVAVVTSSRGGPDHLDQEPVGGVRVLRTDTHEALGRRDAGHLLRVRSGAAAFIGDFDPDVIHSHDLFLSTIVKRAFGDRPVVETVHNVLLQQHGRPVPLLGRALERAAWVTGVSAAALREVLAICPEVADRCSVVRNGLPIADGAITRPDTGSPLLCLGRLVPEKGFDRAVAAMASIATSLPNSRLRIAGEGPYRRELTEQIQALGLTEVVRLLGEVEHAQTGDLLRGSAALVMPSVYEGFPMAAVEAAFAGRPVVGTRAAGVSEAVIDGVTGLLVDPDDDRALARAMERMLTEPGLAAELGAAARRRAERELSIGACADAYFELYTRVIGS